jgi:hypothetical protein
MIQTHHDGHGLNESISVQATDEIGPGGAYHSYGFYKINNESNQEQELGYLQFQKGPRDEPGSTSGITEAALLAVLIDRLEAFQAGPYHCEENQQALDNLRAAMTAIHDRAHSRASRGVLGTYKQ